MMENKISHVEFIGIQGSGKTRIREELLKLLKKNNKVVSFEKALYISLKNSQNFKKRKDATKLTSVLPYTYIKPILSLIYSKSGRFLRELSDFELSHTKLYSFVLEKIKSYAERDWAKETLHGVNGLYSRYNIVSENVKDKIVIFDEGFLQRGLSIFTTNPLIKPDKKDIISYVGLIPLPKIVFYISINDETSLKRMDGRKQGRGRMGKMPSNSLKKVMDNGNLYIYTIIKELRKKGVLVVEINNENLKNSIKQLKVNLKYF